MFHVSLEDSGVHGGGLFLPLPVFLCQSKEKPDLFSWGVGGLFLPLPMFFCVSLQGHQRKRECFVCRYLVFSR